MSDESTKPYTPFDDDSLADHQAHEGSCGLAICTAANELRRSAMAELRERISESRTRRISLTGRAPVEIVEADWPVIATAAWHDSNRAPELYGDRAGCKCLLYVRKHADSRVLVYGVFEPGKSDPAGQGVIRAGYLLPMVTSRNVPDAIASVGRLIGASPNLVQACLDALPAEQL